MLQRRKDTEELVSKLFDRMYLCETTKVCLSLLQEVPDTLDVFKQDVPAIGSFKHSTGVTRTEVCNNEDGIIAMLYGVSRKSVGEQYQAFVNVTPIERTQLSAASLAELVHRKGSVTLVNAADAVDIYTNIEDYFKLIADRQIAEPHYQPPPAQDMQAFESLLHLLERIASTYRKMGVGESALDILRRLSGATVSGVIEQEQKEKIVLDGKTLPSKVGALYTDSPYLFKRD